VARGIGGRGEESSDILNHQEAGEEGLDRTGDMQPQPGTGVRVESGAEAGDGDVFDRGSRQSARRPWVRQPSWSW
jgi:hypothetical protein